MKTYGEVEVQFHFFYLGTKWWRVVGFVARSFYFRDRRPQYPLDRLGGYQTQSGCGEKNNILPLPEIEPRL
jgi:hypothetical protein